MNKCIGIKLLSIFSICLLLMCCLPMHAYAGNRNRITISITENAIVGEPVTVKASAGTGVKKVTWALTLNGEPIEIGINRNGGAFVPNEPGTYILTCTVSGRRFSETYTEYFVVSEAKDSAVPDDSTPSEETEPTEDNDLKISLTAPETAMIDVPFTLSIVTSNCAHIEWYINGDYYSELARQINPEGTLQFSTAGTYKITVIGYTEDWSEHVKDTKSIEVYDDSSQTNGNAKEHDRAMYSWDHDYIYEENESILQKAMELTECNILYQELASDADASDVSAFLQRRGEQGQSVYYLCGHASWGIEENAVSMLQQVERVVAYNNAAGDYKFVGIQFDVEPYCLDDFEANADKYMAQYVENCKLAYEAAHEAGLLVEICIPYWWDSSYGYETQLEDIVANACDSLAVMNYYKKDTEASHIETEVALCRKYDKKIINITEMQAPGTHGLTENNTYYNDGIEAVESMWNSLDSYFAYEKLGYSYHYLNVIIELLSLN